MDIYTLGINYVSGLSVVQSWPEMQDLLKRAGLRRPREWQLPVLTCQAVGGTLEQVVPVVVAIACLQIGIIIIDDILDSDPRGIHHDIGIPTASNLAVAFQASGLEVIAFSDTLPSVKQAVLHQLNHMMLETAYGQNLDIQNLGNEQAYWKLVKTKSSPFFSATFYCGALMGGASLEIAQQLGELGHLYGEMIQIHDDLNDVMATPANPDWLQGRSPLPILFAQSVAHPDRERFLELRRLVSNAEALVEAQRILIRCGAVSYCVDQLIRRYQAAQGVLSSMKLVRQEGLLDLFESLIKPVWMLLSAVGVLAPERLLAQ